MKTEMWNRTSECPYCLLIRLSLPDNLTVYFTSLLEVLDADLTCGPEQQSACVRRRTINTDVTQPLFSDIARYAAGIFERMPADIFARANFPALMHILTVMRPVPRQEAFRPASLCGPEMRRRRRVLYVRLRPHAFAESAAVPLIVFFCMCSSLCASMMLYLHLIF